MKRNQVSLFVVLMFAIGLLLAACSTPAPTTTPATTPAATSGAKNYGAAQTIKLAFTLKEDIFTQGAKAFQSTIQEGTGGAVKMDIYGEATLYDNPQNLLAAVSTNAVQAALVSQGDFATFASAKANAPSLPGIFSTRKQVTGLLEDPAYIKAMSDPSKAKGLHYVGGYSTAFAEIYTIEKLETVASLKGKKIRTIPGYKGDEIGVKALGAVPTTVTGAELQTALQQKMVDGACTVFYFWVQNSWPDVCKYRTGFVMTMGSCYLVVSEDWYNKQTADMKALLDSKVFPTAMDALNKTQQSKIDVADSEGVKRGVITLSPSKEDLATAASAAASARGPLEDIVGQDMVQLAKKYGNK